MVYARRCCRSRNYNSCIPGSGLSQGKRRETQRTRSCDEGAKWLTKLMAKDVNVHTNFVASLKKVPAHCFVVVKATQVVRREFRSWAHVGALSSAGGDRRCLTRRSAALRGSIRLPVCRTCLFDLL